MDRVLSKDKKLMSPGSDLSYHNDTAVLEEHNFGKSLSRQVGLCSLNYKFYQASLGRPSLLDMEDRIRGRKHISYCKCAFILGPLRCNWALPILIFSLMSFGQFSSPHTAYSTIKSGNRLFRHPHVERATDWNELLAFPSCLVSLVQKLTARSLLKIQSWHGRAPFGPGAINIGGHLLVYLF